MDEIWKDVIGYEGLYQVSNLGRVKSLPHYEYLKKSDYKRFKKERILKPFKAGANYLAVSLGRGRKEYIHRLVAVAFIPNPLNKEEVDHINCDITDNAMVNLKWVTRKENLNNPITKKRNSTSRKGWYQPKGKENKRSRPILQYSLNGEFIKEWGSQREIKRTLGYSNGNIYNCCALKAKTAYGYIWRFKEMQV